MKRILRAMFLTFASAATLGTAAQAEDWAAFSRGAVPAYQQGSGHRAGGPASELISPTGGPVLRHRSAAERERIPAYQLGSGQRAGGPARELISATGGPVRR